MKIKTKNLHYQKISLTDKKEKKID